MSHQRLSSTLYRPIILARCGGRCEQCGEPLDRATWQAHHRRLRSHGGPDCPCNLMALHPGCHATGPAAVHRMVTSSLLNGRLVLSMANPAEIPLWLPPALRFDASVREVLLSCGGTYV